MIEKKQLKKMSKFLSLILRHRPELINISLDSNGWTDVKILIEKMVNYGKKIDIETLKYIVENNDKKRFSFNSDNSLIRANQGHSLKIDLGYKPKDPPEKLYHGTAKRFVESIYKNGLQKKGRHHVHLSEDIKTAKSVGGRHGVPTIFEILTQEMLKDGFIFYQSENGVWLVDNIPPKYLIKLEN